MEEAGGGWGVRRGGIMKRQAASALHHTTQAIAVDVSMSGSGGKHTRIDVPPMQSSMGKGCDSRLRVAGCAEVDRVLSHDLAFRRRLGRCRERGWGTARTLMRHNTVWSVPDSLDVPALLHCSCSFQLGEASPPRATLGHLVGVAVLWHSKLSRVLWTHLLVCVVCCPWVGCLVGGAQGY